MLCDRAWAPSCRKAASSLTAVGLICLAVTASCTPETNRPTTTPYSLRSISLAATIETSSRTVRALSFSTDSSILYAADAEGRIAAYDRRTGRRLAEPQSHGAGSDIAFAGDGSFAVVATLYRLHMVDPLSGRTLRELTLSKRPAVRIHGDLLVSADGSTAVMTTSGGSVTAVSLADRDRHAVELQRTYGLPGVPLAISPDGEAVLLGGAKTKNYALWIISNGHGEIMDTDVLGRIRAAAFYPNGVNLLMITEDHGLRVIDSTQGSDGLFTPEQEITGVNVVAISNDGSLFVTGHLDGSIAFWSLPSRQLAHRRQAHGGAVESLAFSSDGQWLASGGDHHLIRVWNLSGIGQSASMPADLP